jgi:hypothetical protein
MDARLVDLARRNWQAVAALVVLLAFAGLNSLAFSPLLARLQRNLDRAGRLGMPIGVSNIQPLASPRVAALLADVSLTGAVAEEQGTSGALTAALLEEVTRLATGQDLEVVATEQGLVTQLPGSVQVRAHLVLRGRYAGFLDLLEALSRSRSLIGLDRFTIRTAAAGGQEIEVWVNQLILKRSGNPR